MNKFNLLISCSRYNEMNATAEIWFTLLICDDSYPIISNSDYPGLITAATNANVREIITKIQQILVKDPNFFKFVLKIIPIDYVCETNLGLIKDIVKNNYANYINSHNSIRIEIKRRKSKIIERETLISVIANLFNNKVNLDSPDKIIRFEILGNTTGIAFLEPNSIISVKEKKNQF
ncbi:MAG: THUMP domain-containing protein [Candidatus Thorarchaeota archaeon]